MCTYLHTSTFTHTEVHLDCVAVTVGPWVCSLSGSAWVRARVQCTMVGALHHSASWLDRPWLWGPSRSCCAHSNCALLRKGFCILLMDYSPSSPVWVDSVDRQTHTVCWRVVMTSKVSWKFALHKKILLNQINITTKSKLCMNYVHFSLWKQTFNTLKTVAFLPNEYLQKSFSFLTKKVTCLCHLLLIRTERGCWCHAAGHLQTMVRAVP